MYVDCFPIRDAEEVSVAQPNDTEQHNNSQHNINVSQESNDTIQKYRKQTATDPDKKDQKAYDDKRKKGELTVNCEVNDTDVGDV